MIKNNDNQALKGRARGALLGLFIGDSLGSQVEFIPADEIAALYPEGVRSMADLCGPHGLQAGQVTDDGEMAIELVLSIAQAGPLRHPNRFGWLPALDSLRTVRCR